MSLPMTSGWKKTNKNLFFSSFLYHLESDAFYLYVFLRCSTARGFETFACQDLSSQSSSEPLFAFNTHHPAFRKFLPGSREGVSSNTFFPKPRNRRILWECFVEYVHLAEREEGGWKKEPVVLVPSFVHFSLFWRGLGLHLRFLFLFLIQRFLFIYFRESVCTSRRSRGRGRENLRQTALSTNPYTQLDPVTLRSLHETKSKVRCSISWIPRSPSIWDV